MDWDDVRVFEIGLLGCRNEMLIFRIALDQDYFVW
jgi:hypothetical protein